MRREATLGFHLLWDLLCDDERVPLTAAFDLTGHTAFVSGAGGREGIGFAVAEELGGLGARVVVTSTTDRIYERVAELRLSGIDAAGFVSRLETEQAVSYCLLRWKWRNSSPTFS